MGGLTDREIRAFWPRHTETKHEKLLAFEIPVPSIEVQERVLAELDALQAKVEAVKTLQAQTGDELDAMFPAIIDKALKGQL